MELRQFWKIIRRRWWLLALPALLTLALGLLSYRPAVPGYNAGVRFIVGQAPGAEAAVADEQRYYNWLTSEYIVNGLTDWVKGGEFATAVSGNLANQGIDVAPGAIQGGISADNARSMLTVSVSGGDAETLGHVMDGVIEVLTTRNAEGLPQLGGETAVLVQLDEPVVNQIPGSLRDQLDLPLRVALALIAGFGLALLVEYLDPTVRDRREIEQIGLPILGEIPRERRKTNSGTQ